MDPITGGIALLSGLKSSGAGGVSMLPNITANPASGQNSPAVSSTGVSTNTSGGISLSGVALFGVAGLGIYLLYKLVRG